MLLEENDSLQRKLLSQEDDFRLQNETLMKELGQVGGEETSKGSSHVISTAFPATCHLRIG